MFGTLRFPANNMAKVKIPLVTLVETTREEDGCIAYDVAEDMFDPGLIRCSEIWPDHSSLQKHLVAAHIAPWREACANLGLIERSFTAFDGFDAKSI
ncbi:putative quinol monooxygenase [Sphingorhabdus sp.]|uniref:putative quinol monooxygenase n=1 Tax=Sphingorhabdus sp. TaxID=1902408 RepID=UPI0032B87252